MAKFRFKAEDVRRVVQHAIHAPAHQERLVDYVNGKAVYETGTPSVVFVKDEGVYLMSNGTPRDIVSDERSFVAYAIGYGPEADYDKIRDAAGGDDFGETLPWVHAIGAALHQGATEIVINLTSRNITLSATYPKKAKVT